MPTSPIRIRDVMHPDPQFLAPSDTAQGAARLMGDLGERALPVGTPEDLQGILTDGDLLIRVLAEGRDGRTIETAAIMTKWVVVCDADDPPEGVIDEMISRNIRRMPVVDRQKRVIGMVALDDLAPQTPRPDPQQSRDDRRRRPEPAAILVVEDDQDIRELLVAMLSDDGHDCAETGSCASARALIEAQGFDLVISDMQLPDGSGTDVAQTTRAAGAPCLLITGDANQMQRLQFRDEQYLAKPFRASELRQRVRGMLPDSRVRAASAASPPPARSSEGGRGRWFRFRVT